MQHKEQVAQSITHHKETIATETAQRQLDRQFQATLHQKELDMTNRHHQETLALEKELRLAGK
jgi:hypothetical protein